MDLDASFPGGGECVDGWVSTPGKSKLSMINHGMNPNIGQNRERCGQFHTRWLLVQI